MANKPVRLIQPYTQVQQIPSEFWGSPVLRADRDIAPYVKAGEMWCPGYLGNTFSKNPYDALKISIPLPFMTGILQRFNVDRTPGIAEIQVRKGRQLDRKKSKGSDGQRLTFTGIDNADVEVIVKIWTPQQLAILLAMWAVLQPHVNKGTPQAFQCQHPQLKLYGINALTFTDAQGLSPGPEAKTKVLVMKAIEYFPPGTKSTTKSIKKAEARGSTLDRSENQPPGHNSENLGPR